MSEEKTLRNIIEKNFGEKIYKKALTLSNNSVKIIEYTSNPLKVRSLIFENEREFHLIINSSNYEIFHDCPTFLIYSERNKKICHHLIKAILFLDENDALNLIRDIDNYNLTYEDFGSKKKSKNFLILAKQKINSENYIEALNYLKKALINQKESRALIQRYLELAIENNLYIEFFEFLESCYLNAEIQLKDFDIQIEKGFKNFLESISDYSFFQILKIISYLDTIFQYKSLQFLKNLKLKLKELMNSDNLKQEYFSFYITKKNLSKLKKIDDEFSLILESKNIDSLKDEIIEYFLNQIENFAIIDKLILFQNQFDIIGVPKERYQKQFEDYKKEIQELEQKVYLRKFAYLKLLAEKFNVKRSKLNFRKKRNLYVVNHNEQNIENPAYLYIINLIGFFGLEFDTIKSSDIGINYFLFRELFEDDFNQFPDIFYYKNQYWGDLNIPIHAEDGYSLLKTREENSNAINFHYPKDESIILIEWGLSKKPIKGNMVNALSSQLIIPDQNNPLFHDLKPFDITVCNKDPVKIEGDFIKSVNIIAKVSFKIAISLIEQEITFIEGYYPFSLVRSVIKKQLNPFEAYDIAVKNPNKDFIPNYDDFLNEFQEFLYQFINKESEYVFSHLRLKPEKNMNQLLSLLNLKSQISGLNFSFSEIVKKILEEETDISEFKQKFLDKLSEKIQNLLSSMKEGITKNFDVKKMKNSPFQKYIPRIIRIRKEEFEKAEVYKVKNHYNVTKLKSTYYGKKIYDLLELKNGDNVNQLQFKQIKNIVDKLNLTLNLVD